MAMMREMTALLGWVSLRGGMVGTTPLVEWSGVSGQWSAGWRRSSDHWPLTTGHSLMSCAAEASGAAVGGGEFVYVLDFFPFGGFDFVDDHLGDAHSAGDGEVFGSEVDEEHFDFSAVVGVDGAGGVGH